MAKTVVLTGGGTAGHVTPHFALIPRLQQLGYDVHYIGSCGMEKGLMEAVPGVTYHEVSSGKLRRYFSLKNFSDPFRTLAGISQSLRLMKSIRPSVVFSKGGFVGVPVAIAAHMRHIPVIVHESDYSLGLANRIAAPYAGRVCAVFPHALERLPAGKGLVTGTPIRPSILAGDQAKGRALCGFAGVKPVIFVVGGSSGAQALNEAIRKVLPALLRHYDVVHACGKGNLDEALANVAGYKQFEYLDAESEYPHILALADLAVSRAGANALVEFMVCRKPTLFIPLPCCSSRGDQILNSRFAQDQGLCSVLMQEDITEDKLLTAVEDVYQNRAKYKMAMEKSTSFSDGTDRIMELIVTLGRDYGTKK